MSVKVIVDRKMGTYHPEHPDLYYPINYGYIPDAVSYTHLDVYKRQIYISND